MTYSEKLKQHYEFHGKSIRFEDGVTYKPSEMAKLQNESDETLLKVHEVKKAFLGEVVK